MCHHILVKLTSVKFNEYPLNGLRVATCGYAGNRHGEVNRFTLTRFRCEDARI
jgi:hypothetical protein